MDNTLGTVLTVLLGGGGLAALLNAIQAMRSKKAGVPSTENAAIVHTGGAGATSVDWQSLNAYWVAEVARKDAEITRVQQELANVRASARRRERHLEARVDQLEQHIWLGRPAPPPADKGPNRE